MNREVRTLQVLDLEVRAGEGDDGEGFRVRGHAMTWDDPYTVWDFEEQVDRGAVPDDIGSQDVFAFWSHDSSIPLARTLNGTLQLVKDEKGLAVDFELPASRAAEAEAISTGLVDRMSVGFFVVRQQWEERKDLPDLRTILEMQLLEVSPVAIPANPNTDLSAREKEYLVEARAACLGAECKRDSETADGDELVLSSQRRNRLRMAELKK